MGHAFRLSRILAHTLFFRSRSCKTNCPSLVLQVLRLNQGVLLETRSTMWHLDANLALLIRSFCSSAKLISREIFTYYYIIQVLGEVSRGYLYVKAFNDSLTGKSKLLKNIWVQALYHLRPELCSRIAWLNACFCPGALINGIDKGAMWRKTRVGFNQRVKPLLLLSRQLDLTAIWVSPRAQVLFVERRRRGVCSPRLVEWVVGLKRLSFGINLSLVISVIGIFQRMVVVHYYLI